MNGAADSTVDNGTLGEGTSTVPTMHAASLTSRKETRSSKINLGRDSLLLGSEGYHLRSSASETRGAYMGKSTQTVVSALPA